MSTTTTAPQDSTSPSAAGHRALDVDPRALAAEFFGTLLLVFFAVGVAIFAEPFVGVLGIALAFGFVLLALVYAIGPVSGCHVNPAVTLGMVLGRRISPVTGLCYWVVQLAGGLAGAALLAWLADSVPVFQVAGRGSFGSDGYGANSLVHISAGGAFLAETILTALLVFVVLCTTHGKGAKGPAGIAIGLSLAVIHLLGIPLTGTSVNPARALGPAVFAENDALSQVWLFLVAPLVGAVIAVLVHFLTHGLPGTDNAPTDQPAVPASETPGGTTPDGAPRPAPAHRDDDLE
ncbi:MULTISPECIES: aquaporin [unclassified Streptomyces]|uniref:aquaporin n=1 Tax=Streptomyces TaxID=1883 RepID=UPI0001C1B5D6|nr:MULTISPECIES: aquaporin [unclassified Streptomyces]AEN08492.1 MIP family channel protein [Streptomyces sp. SirexAA-E]MYR69423.1 porin [Streptomyces sp. SID4939]MYS03349.1 porin [Streptomyces sp. SID4940]MYT66363.1 porin [Streptomyces sp. SID8357]MYT83284.1 porin [Streptomyces sp. SID8360]